MKPSCKNNRNGFKHDFVLLVEGAEKKARGLGTAIAQQHAWSGTTTLENAHKLIAGETIPDNISAEVTLITKENP